jgi:hypothetical protein
MKIHPSSNSTRYACLRFEFRGMISCLSIVRRKTAFFFLYIALYSIKFSTLSSNQFLAIWHAYPINVWKQNSDTASYELLTH